MTIEYRLDGVKLEQIIEAASRTFQSDKPFKKRMQATVSLQGDVAVMPFFPDKNTHGVGWLLLEPLDETGEPGRDLPDRLSGERTLSEQYGVLIGATNPRSLDTIIRALTALRDKLRAQRGSAMADLMDEEDMKVMKEIDRAVELGRQNMIDTAKGIADEIDKKIIDDVNEMTAKGKLPWGKVTQ